MTYDASTIPQPVRLACQRWGAQKRRAWFGVNPHGDLDGYAQSLLGRIRAERDGASCTVRGQRTWEVYSGDGLAVQRAIAGMPLLAFDALHVRYVFDPRWELSGRDQARLLGVGRTRYAAALDSALVWVWAGFEAESRIVAGQQIPGVYRAFLLGQLRKALAGCSFAPRLGDAYPSRRAPPKLPTATPPTGEPPT